MTVDKAAEAAPEAGSLQEAKACPYDRHQARIPVCRCRTPVQVEEVEFSPVGGEVGFCREKKPLRAPPGVGPCLAALYG